MTTEKKLSNVTIAELADAFGKSIKTITRWIESDSILLTTPKAQEIIQKNHQKPVQAGDVFIYTATGEEFEVNRVTEKYLYWMDGLTERSYPIAKFLKCVEDKEYSRK